MSVKKIRFPDTSGIGIKPVSREGTERLVRKAIQYAIANKRSSVTLVHKGNIMKFTEGAFRDWGYALAKREFGAQLVDGGPWMKLPSGIVIKDVIADAFLQQILLRPEEYDVIATLNLNGDYISDAPRGTGRWDRDRARRQSVGLQSPCSRRRTEPLRSMREKDYVNPGSLILSAEMMLRHMGWLEAADLIIRATEAAISARTVTYDFARLMTGATQVSCSGFGDAMIGQMRARMNVRGARPDSALHRGVIFRRWMHCSEEVFVVPLRHFLGHPWSGKRAGVRPL